MDNKVSVLCRNNNVTQDYPIGISLSELLDITQIKLKSPIVGATVNNVLHDMSYRIFKPKTVEFIELLSIPGQSIYSRSLWMLAAKAAHDVADAPLIVEHPVNGGYYCTVGTKVTDEFIAKMAAEMKDIISRDRPFVMHTDRTENVIKLFESVNSYDNTSILKTSGREYTDYFELDGYIDYYPSVLVPSAGCLGCVDVRRFHDGIILVVPDIRNTSKLSQIQDSECVYSAHKEFTSWNRLMGMRNVGDFNNICINGGIRDLIKISEALHEKKIAAIAEMIKERKPKFVMISGPSSSGKTTFSKRLEIQLRVCGISPIVLSLDNFFVEREQTPLDEKGDYDYEHLQALDLPLLNSTLNRLLSGEEVEIPTYSFADGRKYFKGNKIKLDNNQVVVMEGIHALNPDMVPDIPADVMFKIFAAPLAPVSFSDHNWLSHLDVRLIRRIVRDHNFRANSAQDTIRRWPSVVRGELKWIYPFMKFADVVFNSALIFELAVMKIHVEPLLRQVPETAPEHVLAYELLNFLECFQPVFDKEIPPTSLLREFLGGSSFHY